MPLMPIISHLLCSGSAGPQGCRLCCHCLVMFYFISLCAFCAIRLILLPQRERIRITVFQCLLFHLWVLLKIHIKKPPVHRTSGSLSNLYADKSDYSGMRVKAPRFRYPLESAFSAAGILVPWRSYGRYEIVMLSVFLFNIAFPFRICDPVLFIFRYYNMNCLLCHYTGGINFLLAISRSGSTSFLFNGFLSGILEKWLH